ncbi:hypothetical protein BDV93DRAFT_520215 [Ceratobasidium sp. AG-I]|nr:hypothetical protein BDV93DRAFT_520215 [Ceratobasidium sp. AG-I]
MPPFSMLRTKKGRKSRPRTPPSPSSFYSPARSPAPWIAGSSSQQAGPSQPARTPVQPQATAPLSRTRSRDASGSRVPFLARHRTHSMVDPTDGHPGAMRDSQGSSSYGQGSQGPSKLPPSAWSFVPEITAEKALPRPPRQSSSDTVTATRNDYGPALQLDLGSSRTPDDDLSSWFQFESETHSVNMVDSGKGVFAGPEGVQSRRPSAASSFLPHDSPRTRGAPLGEVPGPKSSRPLLPSMPSGSSDLVNTHRRVPTPIKIPRTHVHAPSVTIERTPAARSPSPSPSGSVATTNHSAQPTLASTSNSTPTTSSSAVSGQPSPDPSMISESAPELVTVLRAERASAAMYGIGFGLTLRPSDSVEQYYNAGAFARQDSATLPREGPYMTRASVVNGRLSPTPGPSGLSPVPGSSSTGPSMSAGLSEGSPLAAPPVNGAAALSPAPSSSVALAPSAPASSTATTADKGKSPVLRRSISTDEGLAKSSRSRPETIYAPQSGIHRISEIPSTPRTPAPQESPSSASPMRSPTRHRAKTLASPGEERRSPSLASGRELTGREIYMSVGRESPLSGSRQRALTVDGNPRAHQASTPGSGIRRSRSPSAATTTTTHPSRPVTPPDAHPLPLPVPVQRTLKTGNMSTQAQVADLAIQTGGLPVLVEPDITAPAPSPTSPVRLSYLESPQPPVRTMRLQSAPQISSVSPAPGPALSLPGPSIPAPVPTATGSSAPGPASLLSKFARSQMSFEGFSFLGGRSRSVSDTTVVQPPMQRERGWTVASSPLSPIAADGEASPSASSGVSPGMGIPVRPARRPSLTLTDDPPVVAVGPTTVVDTHDYRPRLAHSHSGSSTGSGYPLGRAGSTSARGSGARLRRKRSSPRQGGTKVLPEARDRSGSESAVNSSNGHYRTWSTNGPGLQRTGSTTNSSSSHRATGTQQPTPTSTGTSPAPATPALALKQRRETMFPSTPRSFSHESTLDSPGFSGARGGPVPDFPGFVLDGSLLMPMKSPTPVPVASGSGPAASSGGSAGTSRKAHLPIGPKLTATPARSETLPVMSTSALPAHTPAPGSSAAPKSTSRSQSKQQQQQQQHQQPQPPSPTFEPVPVRWRGLTMDAAKWTFSSNQLQSIVSRAIKQSAETSSVRLLSLDVLDQELPVEVERLEQLRDVLQTKYKAQVRRRRLLMRSLTLYIDGHDPPTSRRLMDELEDVGVVCDQLAEDLYLVGDQLSQISRLRDVHNTSALAVALRKINGSYIRARTEVVELQTERTALQAERDEAWCLAETLEQELAEAKPVEQSDSPGSESKSRVSAARKSSLRQSKMSLRPSLRRSARSSTSGGSMRYHSIIFPRPPSTSHPPSSNSASDSAANTSTELVPPVPPMPTSSRHLSVVEPSRPESIGVLPSGAYALSPGHMLSPGLSPGPAPSMAPGPSVGLNESYSVLSVPTPSATSHDLYTAQSELLNMLGLSYKEYGFRLRPRSYSDGSAASSPPGSPIVTGSVPPSAYGPRGKLLRSTSDQALRRHSSVDRVIAVQVPAKGGVLEDPAAILAALTLPQD